MAKQYTLKVEVKGYATALDASRKVNVKTKVPAGSYYVFNEYKGMVNVTRTFGVPGSWINPEDNIVRVQVSTQQQSSRNVNNLLANSYTSTRRGAGFRVLYYDKHDDKEPLVLHDTSSDSEKVAEGKIEQSLSDIHTFDFEILYNHPLYNNIKPFVGIIKVINKFDGEVEFLGRVLQPDFEMDNQGAFSKRYTCESVLGYLQDSTQSFQKVPNKGIEDYLRRIIDKHNSQVEPHKQFKLGKITVDNPTDTPHRYIGYDTTFQTLKDFVIGRFGGYIVLRLEADGMYLDYLKDVGENKGTPIQVGTNIETARREVDLTNIVTRLVPLGADLEEKVTRTTKQQETGQYVVRARTTIDSVNGGRTYVEDPELVKEFGIIQRPMDWTEISDPKILLARGKQYMQSLKIAISSWTVNVVEMYFIDSKVEKFVLGNKHPIDNPPMSGVEQLQIIKKVIDIVQPESIELTVGSDSMSLSKYQLQQREATESMQKVLVETQTRQNALERTTEINMIKSEISALETVLKNYTNDVTYYNEQMNNTSDQAEKNSFKSQVESATRNKNDTTARINELKQELSELEKGGNE